MKRKELIKIINNLVLSCYVFNISPVMAIDNEDSSILLSKNDDEDLLMLEDNCISGKENALLNDSNEENVDNEENGFINDGDLSVEIEDDLDNKDLVIEEGDSVEESDKEDNIILDESLVNEDILTDVVENVEETDNSIISEVDDNWLNREVARQSLGSEDLYTNLTEDDYLSIKELNMSKKSISGDLPDDILRLTNLEELNLSYTNITGDALNKILPLRQLKYISFNETKISGHIPKEIYLLNNLEVFILSSPNFGGSIPSEIGQLVNLRCLSLEGANLTGEIPKEIGQLVNLEELWLYGNHLTGTIPEELGNLKNLIYCLDLSCNNLTGTIPDSIGNLSNLWELYLWDNNLTGVVPQSIIDSGIDYYLDNNFLENAELQNKINILNTEDITLSIGDKIDADKILNNVEIRNSSNAVIDNSIIELEVISEDSSIINNSLVAINPGTTSVLVKIKGTNFISSNKINITVEEVDLVIEDNWLNREVARQVFGNENRYTELTDDDYLKIRNISLSGKKINKPIPDDIGKLKNLTSLDLRYCNIYGEIPDSIGQLSNLMKLFLSNNSISGELPSSISNLIKLQFLDLNCNNLTGEIPNSICDMINLKELLISGNDLSGEIPLNIGNLKNLTVLSLGGNNLEGELPSSIKNMTSLSEVYINDNNISGSISNILNSLPHSVSYLELQNNNISGEIPSTIGDLYDLFYIDMSNNNIEGEIPASIGNLSLLEYLYLANNNLTGQIPSTIGNIPYLYDIDFSNNDLTGEIPKSIGNLEDLSTLNLKGNRLTGTIPDLSKLTNLVTDDGWDCYTDFSENYLQGEVPDYLLSLIEESSFYNNFFDNVSSQYILQFKDITNINILLNDTISLEDILENVEVVTTSGRVIASGKTDILEILPNNLELVCNDVGFFDNDFNAIKIGTTSLGLRIKGTNFVSENNISVNINNNQVIEDNWLNREVARQVYGNENSYNQLTENDYLKVKVISMLDKELNSEIPEDIGKLRNLEELELFRCNLTGTIPESIGNLTNLEYLDLSLNSLIGEIPESIGNLTNLVGLELSMNSLTGEIPESISNLSNVEWLYLYDNNLTGEIPKSIENLINLEYLDLSFNSLTGEIPESIGNLTNLTRLFISDNNLTGEIPESIGNLTNLEYLYLCTNNLSGRIPGFVYNVNYLRIENNNFIGNVPENAKSKFGDDAFENNLFNNVSNQKYMEFIGTDDICLNVGDQANLHNLNDNIKLYNYDGTVYSDTYNLNYPLEYVYDTSILDENFIALRKGSTNVSAKIADTDIISKNDILVDVRDNINPTIDAIVSTTEYINGDVEISIKASDNDAIDKIILPDGSESRSNNFVCTVSENGEYTFIAVDRSGNTSSVTVVVNNIDREMPSIQLSLDKSSWTNGSVGIKMVALDDGKISKVILPDGSESKLTDLIYNVTSNGDYEFMVIDGAGNTSKEKISVRNIDNKKPSIKLSASNIKDDNSVDITVVASDDESGIQSIEMSDGTKLTLNNNVINVKKNGIYKFVVTDKAGNVNESIIEIANIVDKSLVDKEAPIMSYVLSESDKTNKDVLINVMATDNKKVDYITNPDGRKSNGSASIYKVDKNGKYKFEAVDTSGNKSEIIVSISNIDKEEISAFINQSELLPDDTVDLVLNLNKAEEEIKSIKVNGTVSIDASSPTLNVDKNGTYQFFVEDKANNTTIAATKVDSIPFEGEDFEKPIVNYLLDTYSWVNDSVGICVYASDNQGVKSIKTPDGNIVEDSAITYIVEDNGLYEFEVEDLSGNIEILTVDISNIDKVSPFAKAIEEESGSEDKTTVIAVNLEDEESGIDNVILPNNVLVKGDSFTMAIEKDMEYEVVAKDKAGNENKITIKVESNKDNSDDDLNQDIGSSDKPNNEDTSNNTNDNESGNLDNEDKNNQDNNKNNQSNTNLREDEKASLVEDETLNKVEEDSTESNKVNTVEIFDWEDVNKEDKMLILMAIVIGVIGFSVMFIVVIGKKEEDDNDNLEN